MTGLAGAVRALLTYCLHHALHCSRVPSRQHCQPKGQSFGTTLATNDFAQSEKKVWQSAHSRCVFCLYCKFTLCRHFLSGLGYHQGADGQGDQVLMICVEVMCCHPAFFTSRVPSPVSAPPHSLTAPAAGLVSLSTAAVPSQSPQLLNPGTSIGLSEAAALAAHVAVGSAAAAAGNERWVPGKNGRRVGSARM